MTATLPITLPGDVTKRAIISPDGLYRYKLGRTWDPRIVPATFIMLNPSTADAEVDDRTIGRCMSFAREWGCGGLIVVNLYAYRSTMPERLWAPDVLDPVGPENDRHITDVTDRSFLDFPGNPCPRGPLVAAWGVNARPDRVAQVLALPGMDQIQCLGVTKDGHPGHPLYVKGGTPLRPFAPSTPQDAR